MSSDLLGSVDASVIAWPFDAGSGPPVGPALRKLPKDILEAGPSHLPLPTERGRAVAQKLRVKRMGHPRVYLFMNN